MQRKAFTLIELLICVAIIAILAAIAVPNFLEAQTRAKTSRVKNDLRAIATALESYAVDRNSYPGDGNGVPYRGLKALTSPISYITALQRDPFNNGYVDGYGDNPSPEKDNNFEKYYELGTGNLSNRNQNFPAQAWALTAYGPDIDDDTDTVGAYPYTRRAVPYDPTNGTVSNGDIYRLGPNDRHPNYLSDANPLQFPP